MNCKKNSAKSVARRVAPAIETADKTEQTASLGQFNSTIDTSFFYTNDKKLNAIDDLEIIAYLQQYYPQFNQQAKDSQLKKQFLQILDDEELMTTIMQHYDMTIYDFFKIIYKHYSSLFNALFVRKVQDKLQCHSYDR